MRSRRPGWTEARGPRSHHRTPRNRRNTNPDLLIFSPPLLSLDVARLWTCVRHPPMQRQPEVMQHNLLFDPKDPTIEKKFQTCVPKGSCITPSFGQQTVDHTGQSHEPCSTQQTSRHATKGNTCQQRPSSTDGKHENKIASSDEGQS